MARRIVTKDPDAIKNYSLNYGNKWLETGETISTSEWTVPSGITEKNSGNTATIATIELSGGTAGSSYKLLNRIVTTGGSLEGYTRDFTLIVRVIQK